MGSAHARFDDGARYAFVASASDQSIFIIDLEEQETASRIAVTSKPDAVAASDALSALVVSHLDNQSLTLVDLQSESLDGYDYPLEIRPDLVKVSPIGETVAVVDREAGILQVHAVKRRKILVSAEGVSPLGDITFNPDGSIVYWTDAATGTVNSLDLWSERRELKLARDGHRLSALSRSVDGSLGFISNADIGQVLVVDLKAFRVLHTISVGGEPERPWGTSDGQYMLVPNATRATITAISTMTGQIAYTAASVIKPASINPGWIDTVAAVVGSDGNIQFLSIADGRELARETVAEGPEAAIVTSDSKTLAVPLPGDGAIAFFDMRSRKRLATIDSLPLDIGPAALAISNNLCH